MSTHILKDGAVVDPNAAGRIVSPEGKPTVTVLDYGSGNVRSAVRALERAGYERLREQELLSDEPWDRGPGYLYRERRPT